MQRFRKASSFCKSVAVANPHQAGEQYKSLDSTLALKTACSASGGIPWKRKVLRANRDCEQLASVELTCSDIADLLVIVTPRMFIILTLLIPTIGAGTTLKDLQRGFMKTISVDLLALSFKLLVEAHFAILSSSASAGVSLLLGTIK